FDTGQPNSWNFGTNYTNSLIVSDLVHSGNGAMKIVGLIPGAANTPTYNRCIQQILTPAPPSQGTSTMSFWYWATNSANNLTIRIIGATGLATSPNGGPTNINISTSPAFNTITPGTNNIVAASLPSFPTLWINEVQAENLTGILD